MAGETARGLALVDEHLKEFPRDALLVNQAGSTIGFGGRPDREEFRQAFLERLAPAYGDDWWFQSALAFTYHETGRFDESRRLSERSLEQYPGNANASHNIAHICFETADNDGGVAFLEPWLAGYDRRAPFHCHLAWHLALFELHRGRSARALEIYERDIVGGNNPRLAVMDGTALLWRFGLFECREGPLSWRPLADLAAQVSRPGFVFGEIHAALAYASCGDEEALAKLDRQPDGSRGQGACRRGHGGAAPHPRRRRLRRRRLRGRARPHRARRRRDPPHGRQPRPVGDLRRDHGRLPPQAQPPGRRHHAPPPPPPAPPVPQRSTVARPGPISRRISHANTRMNLWRQTWAT